MKLKKENDPNIKKVLLLNEDTIEKINELSELLALEGQKQDFRDFLNESLDRAIKYFKTKNKVWKWFHENKNLIN
jgi:hypothetical protein|tara:strand:- start:976 stop:1200 length:225 start_codon:yes stop_codon:yes gene_type:complete